MWMWSFDRGSWRKKNHILDQRFWRRNCCFKIENNDLLSFHIGNKQTHHTILLIGYQLEKVFYSFSTFLFFIAFEVHDTSSWSDLPATFFFDNLSCLGHLNSNINDIFLWPYCTLSTIPTPNWISERKILNFKHEDGLTRSYSSLMFGSLRGLNILRVYRSLLTGFFSFSNKQLG